MPLAVIFSRGLNGLDAPQVRVEVHLANGLPAFTIVGLADTGVRESKDRVRAAIIQSGFEFPNRRITVNLAPADLPKYSGRFDLAIALGILAASAQLPCKQLDQYEFAGELSLSGELRPFSGCLAIAMAMRKEKSLRSFIIPQENCSVTSIIPDLSVLGANCLTQVCDFLCGRIQLEVISNCAKKLTIDLKEAGAHDIAHIQGHLIAKRGLEIAAAGFHSLLLAGPPGCGKSMLAKCLPQLLPKLTLDEALEIAALHSLKAARHHSALESTDLSRLRPWQNPHHSITTAALVGGGAHPLPGAITLAHQGVLFLDELPQFARPTLEALREPLQNRRVTITRAHLSSHFPCNFMLVAAMNLCICGYFGHPEKVCVCSAAQRLRYQNKISGPLLDRIDIKMMIAPVPHELFFQTQLTTTASATSSQVATRIANAWALQISRQGKMNHALDTQEMKRWVKIDAADEGELQTVWKGLNLSGRGIQRLLKIARTIADLEGSTSTQLKRTHLLEASALSKPINGMMN
ncbi:YifB family Mg chelatase-like AAA ATPase [Polynucleobacter sp. IMCC30063]|uniref:YifB family Mg chelatase-like AAA ATPase n=1 Tax=unclassified Polynucleobacter TaxID=2640945 RepID=UPI001F48EA2E|nr:MULTISPECIES: YifB family Mg chelatase-like AAA ATPase [unclassified Polynucleobacter]MCE7504740.1 YifB family Mg chelatase-like AAA ATPase [Polynucleobacter sp. IMCC30063]MCE7526456.1 YifB family Mg chelatase-like AAA ATPase [Polynucleobacter sp. IMCC 30228]